MDKRSLYVECLQLFGQRTLNILHQEHNELEPLRAVSAFFRRTLCEVPPERVAWGCMMVNTVLELADNDDELQQLALELLARMQADLETIFIEARQRDQLQSPFSPEQLAAHMMTLNLGFRVQSRQNLGSEQLEDTLATSLSLAGIPA